MQSSINFSPHRNTKANTKQEILLAQVLHQAIMYDSTKLVISHSSVQCHGNLVGTQEQLKMFHYRTTNCWKFVFSEDFK